VRGQELSACGEDYKRGDCHLREKSLNKSQHKAKITLEELNSPVTEGQVF